MSQGQQQPPGWFTSEMAKLAASLGMPAQQFNSMFGSLPAPQAMLKAKLSQSQWPTQYQNQPSNQGLQQAPPLTASQILKQQQAMSQRAKQALFANSPSHFVISTGQTPNSFGIAESRWDVLWSAGPYKLVQEASSVMLLDADDFTVCEWRRIPSRRAVAAAVCDHRLGIPKLNARDEYGSLLGVRMFTIPGLPVISSSRDYYGIDRYKIVSPTQKTVWESEVLHAKSWDSSEAVRGVCGIHAAWPPRSMKKFPYIDYDGKDLIVASVRGQGKFVAGTMGWRAQAVIIDTVYLPPKHLNRTWLMAALHTNYPNISFEAEPWTLEKSSKLAK